MNQLLLDSPLSKAQRDCCKGIERSATMLLKLVSDLLDFSKIESGLKCYMIQCIDMLLQD